MYIVVVFFNAERYNLFPYMTPPPTWGRGSKQLSCYWCIIWYMYLQIHWLEHQNEHEHEYGHKHDHGHDHHELEHEHGQIMSINMTVIVIIIMNMNMNMNRT
jgi:hypothetical protein